MNYMIYNLLNKFKINSDIILKYEFKSNSTLKINFLKVKITLTYILLLSSQHGYEFFFNISTAKYHHLMMTKHSQKLSR